MTYTFLKAQGIEIGNSLVEEDKLDVAKELLAKADGKLILPVDSKEANAFADYTEVKDTEGAAVDAGFLGLDIGPKSITKFDEELTGAKTVVWNGPMGVFENPDFQAGTIGVMDAIVKQPGVKSIIGGGDQLPQLSTLVVLTNSHGFLLVVELLWNFLKVKYFQVLQHLLINNNFFVEKI